jgi:2'-5' RNA ligase
MPRIFIAIDLPGEVKDLASTIPQTLAGAKWVPRDQLHLTLRFVGDVEDSLLPVLKKSLAAISVEPFDLVVSGAGCFPARGNARVLWLGLTGAQELFDLQRQVELAVISCGFEPEHRSFSPHLTLARLRYGVPHTLVDRFLRQHGNLSSTPFTIDAFHLYASTLNQTGAVHRKEATFPLSERAMVT